MKRASLLALAAASLTALGADCDGNVVQDPTFRDWCGDTLCAWKLDSGAIQRVPTWNEDDFGVSFTQMGTEISQVTSENQATCLVFTTTADMDPASDMVILVDFNNDGTIDFKGQLGATDWRQVQTEITAPPKYDGITFHILKQGTGTAVLAEMRVVSASGCTAPPTISPLFLGEGCTADSQCSSGLICVSGLCSQCDPSSSTTCANGAACGSTILQANQCGPGQGLGQAGDPCAIDADCQSGSCSGAFIQSLATIFDAGDLGCPTGNPPCAPGVALDGGDGACACYLNHGGTCR
jgi:hypothetical protein